VLFELALIVLRSRDLRGHNRHPRLASPGSTTKVETVHPLLSCQPAARGETAAYDHTSCNATQPTRIPGAGRPPASGASRGQLRLRLGVYLGVRRIAAEMMMTPAGAGGGRNAPAGVDRQGRSRS